jgi:hypothetical protein
MAKCVHGSPRFAADIQTLKRIAPCAGHQRNGHQRPGKIQYTLGCGKILILQRHRNLEEIAQKQTFSRLLLEEIIFRVMLLLIGGARRNKETL